MRGGKRHLLVDTEGLVVKAKVHSAKVPDQDGLRLLLESARSGLSCLRHLFGEGLGSGVGQSEDKEFDWERLMQQRGLPEQLVSSE